MMYKDTFQLDGALNRTMFKNHYMDEIIFQGRDSAEAILKRDNYEGEYEYFQKER